MATIENINGKNMTVLIKCRMCCMIAIFTNLSVKHSICIQRYIYCVYIYTFTYTSLIHTEMSGWMLSDVNDENRGLII